MNIEQLETKRNALLKQIANIGEFRPGSLSQYHRKCGNPTCHCARQGSVGHPGWQLTRKIKARSVSRGIPAHAVAATRGQVEEHHRFRALIQELTEVSEQLCDLRLKSEQGKKKRRIKTAQANLRG